MTHTTTVSLVVTAAGGAAVISIDFVGQGTVMGSTEVAGVVAKSNWNNASGQTNTTGQALVDESGTATGATVIWNTNGMWNLPITAAPGNVRMIRGYLDTLGATTTVTVSGLPARSGGYAVYVYADGDNGAAARTGAYQISGTGITTTSVNLTDAANTNFSGTFTQANNSNGNYVKFTVTATGFTITATPGAERRATGSPVLRSMVFRSCRNNHTYSHGKIHVTARESFRIRKLLDSQGCAQCKIKSGCIAMQFPLMDAE